MNVNYITYDEAIDHLSWDGAIKALRDGHSRPKPQIADNLLGPPDGTFLNRAAWIEGLGYGVKSCTIFGDNPRRGLPAIHELVAVFDPTDGRLSSLIEGRLVTQIKTASDSVLGATCLARPDSRHILIVGGGPVARSLIRAYSAVFPTLRQISVWTRRPEQARDLVDEFTQHSVPVQAITDLPAAAGQADIISCATMASQPVLSGSWVNPGTHIDLVGAYTPDMREADDELMSKASVFVDSRETTIHHVGELMIPIANGTINEASIRGDLYDLTSANAPGRQTPNEITVFKNGGGAHLDLMIATYISQQVAQAV